MTVTRLAAATVWLCILFGQVHDALADKPGVVRGYGASSCGEFKGAYDAFRPFATSGSQGRIVVNGATMTYSGFQAWAHGYLFGVDAWNGKQIRDFDNPSMNLWLYNWCSQHPLDLFANAARAFYLALGGPPPTWAE